MFTGIVEAVGEIKGLKGAEKGLSVLVSVPVFFDDINKGDSIAVNGVCLTAKDVVAGSFTADVSVETQKNTTFSHLRPGEKVNLERALKLSDRLGGHLVTGHIDGTARLMERRNDGESVRLQFTLDDQLLRYVITKGSIAIDGISLTVNEVTNGSFSVNIIPHSATNTAILGKKAGDKVNIETDIIGKYVERLLGKGKESNIGRTFLMEHGFMK